ncbi:ribosomal subunit 39S-domain-containing protein [Lasiosphaeris hirsuta]|uniref:Large ribosomal subunit protein mL50 n=1 Tax=Lasiosphaeris hirsuta TaxID=260670 RepID=A0AA40A1U3_9PEZI|nr:ribosomal subunit 39S-domain-containing protein [Lasiosphaeris hirsuta]
MRNLVRLRGSASALSTSSTSTVRTAATSSSASSSHTQRRCLSSDVRAKKIHIETDLVYPSKVRVAPLRDNITDPDYVPADRADDLEEVGGLTNWWEQPEHWGNSKRYVGFGPTEKVRDPMLLTVLVRRAVIEAVALRKFSPNIMRPEGLLAVTRGQKELLNTVEVTPIAAGDGSVTLGGEKGDWVKVWAQLSQVKRESEEVKKGPAPEPELTPAEAKVLVQKWGSEWKSLKLLDPVIKFYAAKRIQRLTGHIIPDGKLIGIETVNSLIAYLAKPPKARKLAEEIETTGVVANLSNVAFSPRRVTPLDKDISLGRWKVMKKELEKRKLPVLGTEGYQKSNLLRWAEGRAA